MQVEGTEAEGSSTREVSSESVDSDAERRHSHATAGPLDHGGGGQLPSISSSSSSSKDSSSSSSKGADDAVVVKEGGIKFWVSPIYGQKTGFYAGEWEGGLSGEGGGGGVMLPRKRKGLHCFTLQFFLLIKIGFTCGWVQGGF